MRSIRPTTRNLLRAKFEQSLLGPLESGNIAETPRTLKTFIYVVRFATSSQRQSQIYISSPKLPRSLLLLCAVSLFFFGSVFAQVGRVLCSKAALTLPLALRQEVEIWHSRQLERRGLPSSARLERVEL